MTYVVNEACIKCKYNRRCSKCKNVKPIESFKGDQDVCDKCSPDPARRRKAAKSPEASTRMRQCPVCLKSVRAVRVGDDWVIQGHKKARETTKVACAGAGRVVFRESKDAMDRRVSGSFEGGKRR